MPPESAQVTVLGSVLVRPKHAVLSIGSSLVQNVNIGVHTDDLNW